MSPADAGGGSVTARFVALAPDRWIGPARIDWDGGGRIVSLRRVPHAKSEIAVLPGLVDAHVHLQLTALARPVREFLPWVGAVMAARAGASPASERRVIQAAVGELLAGGTTAVGEIDATGRSWPLLADGRLEGRCYRELTGYHLDALGARELLQQRRTPGRRTMAKGWSPHAPYSVSSALFQAAARSLRHQAIHCAEVPEEQQFLRTGRGPFRDLLERLGRLPAGHRPPACGAVAWLESLGVLRSGTQLIHCQELERDDPARIAAAGASIVVCPGTIEYFRRTPPPVPRWLAAGIPVALGTDSIASNTRLCMRTELQRAAALWPSLSPEQLLAMATTDAGRSLGRPIGRLRRGGRADLLVIPAAPTIAATIAAFVHGGSPVQAVVVGGRWHRHANRRGLQGLGR